MKVLKKLRRAVRVSCVVSSFVWFWSGSVLLAWTVLPLIALVVRDERTRLRACQRVVAASFRLFHGYMRALDLVDVAILGPIPPRAPNGPVVLVANHTTLVDVTAILSRFPNVCCLAKAFYADNPFFGRLLRLAGFIHAGSDLASKSAALKHAVRRLELGFDVLVFPEGTRSPPGGLLPFHRGAFEIACRAKVPIVPLLLRCEPSALTRDRAFWNQPDQVAILKIEPQGIVDPAEAAYRSADLQTRVERSYRQALGLAAET